MSKTTLIQTQSAHRPFLKDTLVKGQPTQIECVTIENQTYSIERGLCAVVQLEDEWYDDVTDPDRVIQALRDMDGTRPDLFTFWQRLPDIVPRYRFHQESEQIAVLPIQSYDHWFNHQIKSRVRSLIRKGEKDGLVVREVPYDDDFVRGMATIFNEAPVRQGRKFWHYGKDHETVKRQFSRFIHRESMIGAFYRDEMVGFIMLGIAGSFGITGQIISSLKHRDKATTNALVAKAVEVCEAKRLHQLVYLFWSDDSLGEFKRRCGFEKTAVPRYYVPLTKRGELALKWGAHHGLNAMMPPGVKSRLKDARRRWYEMRDRQAAE
jgi:hypothetical protein